MRIELQQYDGDLLSLQDLEQIIPKNRKGKALNYGQGEGQVQIDETVWGIYYGRKKRYYIQYEEGSISPAGFKELWKDIIDHLTRNFTADITIDGIHEGDQNV